MNVPRELIDVHKSVIILMEAIHVLVMMAIHYLMMDTPAQVSHFTV